MAAPYDNPFRTAPGSAPPVLVGRDAELSAARYAIGLTESRGAAQPVVFSGLRGMGKTALLRVCVAEAEKRRGVVLYSEASRDNALAMSLRRSLEHAKTRFASIPRNLKQCLDEGQYTKAVELIVDRRDDKVSDDEWDHHTIDYALRRLERKKDAIMLRALRGIDFPNIEPVALVCARDIKHAESIRDWLIESRGFASDELLVSHSRKTLTEEQVTQLADIDQPGNRVRVVINVFRLTEGWDVTNVYEVVPLREMATFEGAIQTMGRGLRLPAGRRVGDADLDRLEVLCFGRETARQIIDNAIAALGTAAAGAPIDVVDKVGKDQGESPIPRETLLVRKVRAVEITIPNLRRLPAEVQLDFDIASLEKLGGHEATSIDLATLETTGIEERIGRGLDEVVRVASARIVAELKYLSEPIHGQAVEELLRRVLVALGANAEEALLVDPIKLALHTSEEIDRRYRMQKSTYERLNSSTLVTVVDVSLGVPEGFHAPLSRVPLDEWVHG